MSTGVGILVIRKQANEIKTWPGGNVDVCLTLQFQRTFFDLKSAQVRGMRFYFFLLYEIIVLLILCYGLVQPVTLGIFNRSDLPLKCTQSRLYNILENAVIIFLVLMLVFFYLSLCETSSFISQHAQHCLFS